MNNTLIKKILFIILAPMLGLYSFFLVNSFTPIANGTDIFYKIKEFIIIPIVRAVANSLMAKVHNRVFDIVRGVGSQGPAFITNWRNEINNTDSRGLDIFRTILSSSQLCPHLDSSIKSAFLADAFGQATGTNSGATSQKISACISDCANHTTDERTLNLLCNNKTDAADKLACFSSNILECTLKCSSNQQYQSCIRTKSNYCASEANTTDCYNNSINNATTCASTSFGSSSSSQSGSTVNGFIPAGQTPFSLISQCTLPTNFNPQTFTQNFSSQGGTDTLLKLLQPQNNELGFLAFIAFPELQRQTDLTRRAEDQERGVSSGFKSFRGGTNQGSSQAYTSTQVNNAGVTSCLKSCRLPSSCTQGDIISQILCAQNNAKQCLASCDKNPAPQSATCYNTCSSKQGTTSQDTFNQAISCGNQCALEAYPPGNGKIYSDPAQCTNEGNSYAYCQQNTKGGFSGDCPEEEKVVGRCINLGGVVTPAQIINSAVGGALGGQINRLIYARDWTDLLTQLIQMVGSTLTNFVNGQLLNEQVSVVSNGEQFAQQAQQAGISDYNSNGTDVYNNLNSCLANCDAQASAQCTSDKPAEQSTCANTSKLACYANCGADSQANNSNKVQVRRLGDSCDGDNAHASISFASNNSNALARNICGVAFNTQTIKASCGGPDQQPCPIDLICSKESQTCTQCTNDNDCQKDFPGRVCDTSFTNSNGAKIGVCVRDGGNDLREACATDNQCKNGYFCNNNRRCRPIKTLNLNTSPVPEQTIIDIGSPAIPTPTGSAGPTPTPNPANNLTLSIANRNDTNTLICESGPCTLSSVNDIFAVFEVSGAVSSRVITITEQGGEHRVFTVPFSSTDHNITQDLDPLANPDVPTNWKAQVTSPSTSNSVSFTVTFQ